MYCRYCGKQIREHSIFCPYCGGRLSGDDAANKFSSKKDGNRQTQKRPRMWPWVVVMILLAAIIVLGLVDLLGHTHHISRFVSRVQEPKAAAMDDDDLRVTDDDAAQTDDAGEIINAVYSELLREYENEYEPLYFVGAETVEELPWFIRGRGVCYTRLIDFDKNGTDELVVAYGEGGADAYGYTMEVWSCDDGLNNLYSGGVYYLGVDGMAVCIVDEGSRFLLYCGQWGENVYALQSGQFVDIKADLEASGTWDDSPYVDNEYYAPLTGLDTAMAQELEELVDNTKEGLGYENARNTGVQTESHDTHTEARRIVQVTHYISQVGTRSDYYDYDSRGNLIQERREMLNSPDYNVYYYYYDNDRKILQAEYNEYATTTYTYDEAGRLIHENGPDYLTDYVYVGDRIDYAISSAAEITEVIQYFYNDWGELVETQSDNYEWAEEMKAAGAEWVPIYENTSYYRWLDDSRGICEVETQGSNSSGGSSYSFRSSALRIVDGAGTVVTIAAQWDDSAEVERDEDGYVEKLTYYNEDGSISAYDVILYEAIS